MSRHIFSNHPKVLDLDVSSVNRLGHSGNDHFKESKSENVRSYSTQNSKLEVFQSTEPKKDLRNFF